MTSRLHGLLEQLEKCEGPDREIDALFAEMDGIKTRVRRTRNGKSKGRQWILDSHGGVETVSSKPPSFTASLDAAVALVEKMLPECRYEIRVDIGIKHHNAAVVQPSLATWSSGLQFSASPSLALLTALIKALIAEEEK